MVLPPLCPALCVVGVPHEYHGDNIGVNGVHVFQIQVQVAAHHLRCFRSVHLCRFFHSFGPGKNVL